MQRLDSDHYLRWTAELHRFKGNVLLADGHVEERNSPSLRPANNQTLETAFLALPLTQPPGFGMASRSASDSGTARAWGPHQAHPALPAQNAALWQPASAYAPGLTQKGRGVVTATSGAEFSTPGLQTGAVKVMAPAKLQDPKSSNATAPEAIPIEAAVGGLEDAPAITWLLRFGLLLWLLMALLVTLGLLRHYGRLKSRARRSRP